LTDRCFLFLDLAMLFEEFIEQHRVHRFGADRVWFTWVKGETVEVGATAPLAAGVGNGAVSDGDGDVVFFFTLTGEAEGDRFFLDFFFRWGVGVGVETIRLPVSPIDCSAASIGVTADMMKAARINTRKNMVSSSL
jgi:hypothetical protein